MKLPLQITTRGFPHSEALDNHIREKAAKLDTFYPGVMGCRVMVEVPHKHKHNGRAFNVRLPGDIRVERPGMRVYVPLTSMLLLSVVISVLLAIVRRLR